MLKFLVFVALAAALFFLYIKYIENTSVFFPAKDIEFTPSHVGLEFKDIYFETKDNLTINGWFIPCEGASYTLLFFHGNGGNISHRLDKVKVLRKAKVNIFLIDYRGYGKSQGKPTEKGVYIDSDAAYDYLITQENIGAKDIILYGESLGAAVAVDLASRKSVAGLILEGGFSSGRDMGKIIYPYLPKLLLPKVLDSSAKIKEITASKLFIHSGSDEVVPISLGRKLYDAAMPRKEFVEITGFHNSGFLECEEKYVVSIAKFIENLK